MRGRSIGRFPAYLRMVSVVLHLSIVETAAFAISHDAELRGRIHRLARRLDTQVDLAKMLRGVNDDVKRYLGADLGKRGTPCFGRPTAQGS